ncbi:Sulphur transport [Aliiroseovarius crassostreae]|nr:Sulphur transport [Aliiroseovarius crassostreae]
MGGGAAVAFGCSIGQGLSAFALLYYGAPVTFLAIVAGAAIGLRHLISGFAITE